MNEKNKKLITSILILVIILSLVTIVINFTILNLSSDNLKNDKVDGSSSSGDIRLFVEGNNQDGGLGNNNG